MKKIKSITIQFKDEPLNFNWNNNWNRSKFNKKLIKKVSELLDTDKNSYSEFHSNDEIVIKLF